MMSKNKKRKFVTFGVEDQKSFNKILKKLPEKYKNNNGFIAFVKDAYYNKIQEFIKK